jgi:hypothetical protein
MNHEHRPAIDLELEVALADCHRAATRLSHGRVKLTIDRYDRATIGHILEVDALTEEDLARLMTERPGVKR